MLWAARFGPLALAVVVIATIASGSATPARAEPISDAARELVERHAPIVRVAPQRSECDPEGEPFAPMSVDLVLGNDDVTLRQAGAGDPVVTRAPTARDLRGRGAGFFLDFNGIAVELGCVYERDYREYSRGRPAVVYAHVVAQDDAPGLLAVQYWLYWYYNDWNNKHESDWEFIQLLFEASSVDEALDAAPVEVGYAQHEGGERTSWGGDELELDGDHPVVYPSRGSHASYFERALFLGRRGNEGIGCDTTTDNVREIRPEVVLLPDSADDGPAELAWLDFEGRWGERGSGPFDGPTGPTTKPRWDRPIEWHDGLRSASAQVPGGEEANSTVLTSFCSVVEFASNQWRSAQVSPLRSLVIGALALLVVRGLVGRTEWTAVSPTPLRERRRVGQKLRAAVTCYVSSRGALLGIAVLYVPLALVVAVVGWVGSFTAAQTVAALLTSVMFLVVSVLVSAYWHLESRDEERTLRAAVDLALHRGGAIVLSLGLALAVVAILALTVVGIPLAIRQIVRYQFVIPVATTEGLSGRDALRRSGALVQGRWWNTGATLLVLVALAALLNSALQLGLLVLLDGVPLWSYVAITFLATGLFVPMVATAPALLYGDAAAIDDEARRRSHGEAMVAPVASPS
ncbi:hypothetical protein [Ilumatobacter sp.]|uniref:hypothetical protein n=1 Tax=Ilumatobacter sp. TaxID=1967498 RepID=UPI003B51BE2F